MNNILNGLSNQQLSVLKSNSNKFLISSCAGSGKTEIIARFALYKIKEYENIILTTFTKSNKQNIINRILSLRQKFKISENKNITVCTIDSLIHKFITQYFPNIDKSDYIKKIIIFDEWLEKNNIYPFEIHYFFIIDEFQDTYEKHLKAKILINLGKLSKGILAVGDVYQTLSNTKENIPVMVFDLFRKTLAPKEFIFNETRRFGKNIANFVNKTTNQGIRFNKNINSKLPVLILHNKLSNYMNAKLLAENLYNNFILKWLEEGYNYNDIGIIQRKTKKEGNYIFSILEDLLKKNKHNVVWYTKEKSSDFSYDIINQNSITLCSIMFSKGLEWQKVIFLNCTGWSLPLKNEKLGDLIPKSTFNVAITRSINELVITTNYNSSSEYLLPICSEIKNSKYHKINKNYVSLIDDNDKLLFNGKEESNNEILTGVYDIAEELSEYEIPELENIKFKRKFINGRKSDTFNQFYQEYQLKYLYGIIGELLMTRELYLKYNNIENLKINLFVQLYNKKIIINDIPIIYENDDNFAIKTAEIDKISRFLSTYRKDYEYYKNILKITKDYTVYKNELLNYKNQNLNNYYNWGDIHIFNKYTRIMFDKKIPIILKSDEIISSYYLQNINKAINLFYNKNIHSTKLPNKTLFYLSCIHDVEIGRIAILRYNDGIQKHHFSRILVNIEKFVNLFEYEKIYYQETMKNIIYNHIIIRGELDYYIPYSNNKLMLARLRLHCAKLINSEVISMDICGIIICMLNSTYNCNQVIEIKCSDSTSLSKIWKLQTILYMCLSGCNKCKIINLMKGIYWECELPPDFNKINFIGDSFKKVNNLN